MVLERGANVVRSFSEAAWALEPSEVSEPIDTAPGVHLVRVGTRIAPVERPFADVADEAAREAGEVELQRLEAGYLTEVAPRYGLERRYEALRAPVREEAVLLQLGGEVFTLGDLLQRLPDSLVPHVYAGHTPHLVPILERVALDKVLVREAKATGFDATAEARRQIERAQTAVRADVEIERRLRARARAVPASELRELYARRRDRYEVPRRWSLSVVRLAPASGELIWSLLREGEQVVDAVRRGVPLADAVDTTAAVYVGADGWTDWTDDDLLRRVLGRARELSRLEDLEVGEVSAPFVGEVLDPSSGRYQPACVYIVRVDRRTPARSAPFAAVEEAVYADSLARSRRRFLTEIEREVVAAADLRVVTGDLPPRPR
jgi:hypothetical protein